MPLDDLNARVATAALRAAADHGFALAGSNALIAHGLTQRPTLDVDLFTDQEHGVEAAADDGDGNSASTGRVMTQPYDQKRVTDSPRELAERLLTVAADTPRRCDHAGQDGQRPRPAGRGRLASGLVPG
jgi:hypothetical protein